jgi:hypothetical protein
LARSRGPLRRLPDTVSGNLNGMSAEISFEVIAK